MYESAAWKTLFITYAKARYLKNDQEKWVSQKAHLSLVTSKLLRDRIVLYSLVPLQIWCQFYLSGWHTIWHWHPKKLHIKAKCTTLSFYPVTLKSKLNQIIGAYLMWTIFLDLARTVFENINKCKEAVVLDAEVNKVMMTNLADKSSLFNTEDSLIKLVASDMVDGLQCNKI